MNVARPATVATVVVPPIVPVPEASTTEMSRTDAVWLPETSYTRTCGCTASTCPLRAVVEGATVMPSEASAPGVSAMAGERAPA